jgi:hypothetical protein
MTMQAHRDTWYTTASFGDEAGTNGPELLALSDHLDHCVRPSPRLFAMRCGAEATQLFFMARVVTTFLLISAVILVVLQIMP